MDRLDPNIQRLLAALRRERADRVPNFEIWIDPRASSAGRLRRTSGRSRPTHHFALGIGRHARTLRKIADCLGIRSVIVAEAQ